MTPVELNVEYLSARSWDARMPERLKWLREIDPVHWSHKDEVWLIAKFEDIEYV